jgi:hypothetical protein
MTERKGFRIHHTQGNLGSCKDCGRVLVIPPVSTKKRGPKIELMFCPSCVDWSDVAAWEKSVGRKSWIRLAEKNSCSRSARERAQ